MERPDLICPYCKNNLKVIKNGVYCQRCKEAYILKSGVISFQDELNRFYEGRFTTTKDFKMDSFLKNLIYTLYSTFSISTYENRFFQKWLRRIHKKMGDLKILDFGCGGGNTLIARYGFTIGVDISISSLKVADSIYNEVYHIDGKHLPFPNESFDLIFSSHVFGHITPEEKNDVISEMFRVLKYGGYMMHSIECDCESLVYRKAKKFQKLYEKQFVEMYGHYGLESPFDNFKRFQKAGLTPIVEKADIHKGYIRPIESYSVWFYNDDYMDKGMLFKILGSVSNYLAQWKVSRITTNVILQFLVPAAFLFTPPNHRDSAKVLYQKP